MPALIDTRRYRVFLPLTIGQVYDACEADALIVAFLSVLHGLDEKGVQYSCIFADATAPVR